MSPYKSRAQQGLFHYLESKGKMPKKTVHEWDDETDYHDLPEHVKQHLAAGGEVGGASTSTTGNKTKTGGSNPGGASTGGAGTVTITTGKNPPRSINISDVGGRTDASNPGGMDPSDEDDEMMRAFGGRIEGPEDDEEDMDMSSSYHSPRGTAEPRYEEYDPNSEREPYHLAYGGMVDDDDSEYEPRPNGPLDRVSSDQLPSESLSEKAARKERERMNAPVNSTYVPDSAKLPQRVKERNPIKENKPRLDPSTGLNYSHGGRVSGYDYQQGRENEFDSAGEPGTEDEMEDKHPMEYMHKGGRKMARGGMANRSGFIKALRRTG